MADTLSKARIKEIQKFLNRWTKRWLVGVQPLIVDGVKGPTTNSRIMMVKFHLGYGQNRDADVTREFLDRMHHPRDPKFFPKRSSMVRTGIARRTRQKAREAQQQFIAVVAPGVTRFDGKPCAVWLAKKLQQARDAGRWKGRLNSGWRSPAFSESLCRQMCGAPSCPGRCAGRSSNHSGSKHPRGAVDVSDFATFERECRRLNLGIKNELDARDPVHFSVSGHRGFSTKRRTPRALPAGSLPLSGSTGYRVSLD